MKTKPKGGRTSLIRAAKEGDTNKIQELLRAGAANIEKKDSQGRTALMIRTAKSGTMVTALLKAGANTEAKDNEGKTALIIAAENWRSQTTRKLLEAGADIEAKDEYGRTALIVAAENGHYEVTVELLEAGADIEAKDEYGRTALTVALGNEHRKVTAELLKAGAAKGENGRKLHKATALRKARELCKRIERKKEKARETNIKVQNPDVHKVSFSTEAELENFICSHWDHTVFGNAFDIYKDTEGRSGKQYPTDLRERIDILAISNDKETFLVIELKVGKAPDTVVAQCQRYMGFVKDKVAKNGQKVRGAIVATEKDKKMERALSEASNVDFYTYKVDYKAVQMSKVE